MTMANDIKISLSVEGAASAASGVSSVSESLEDLQRAQQAAATRAINFTTKLAGAASAVQTLTGQLGVQGGRAGLVASIAANSAAMAQLGAAAGPQGALVGGIVGALIPAMAGIANVLRENEIAIRRHREQLNNLALTNIQLANSYDSVLSAMRRQSSMQNRTQTLAMGLGSRDEQAALVEARRLDVDRLQSEFAAARPEMMEGSMVQRSQRSSEMRDALRPQIEAARARLAEAVAAQRQAAEDFAADTEELLQELRDAAAGADATGGTQPSSGRSGPSRWELEQEAWERYSDAIADGIRVQDELKREQIRLEEEYRAKIEERAQAEIDAALHIKALEDQRAQEQLDAMEERKQEQLDLDDKLRENSERIREEHKRQVEGYQETTGVIVGGLTEALTAIVAGEKSAEDAFKGMLASFLAYIAEQAALKAIFEGAEAIAAFASQRYDQGALHIAAAAGYAAVAVAAGAGSAALSAAPQRPAEPESGRSDQGGGGGGGSIVVNFNSPVLTAGTRAELGRELQQTIAAGSARYG
jgi:hypothetical protein